VTNKVNAEATLRIYRDMGSFLDSPDLYNAAANTNFCVEAWGGRPKQWECYNGAHQSWQIQRLYDDFYYIINRDPLNVNNNGDYLFAKINTPSSGVVSMDYLDTANTSFLWEIKRYGRMNYQIRAFDANLVWDLKSSITLYTDLYLSSSEDPLDTNLNQMFKIELRSLANVDGDGSCVCGSPTTVTMNSR